MRRPSTSTLTFLIPALIVLGVSVVLTVRRGARLASAAPTRFSGATVVQRMPSLLSPTVLSGKPRIVVVRDVAAASFYDRPAMLDSIVRTWQQALASVGADVRVVSSANLGAARDARGIAPLRGRSSPAMAGSKRARWRTVVPSICANDDDDQIAVERRLPGCGRCSGGAEKSRGTSGSGIPLGIV